MVFVLIYSIYIIIYMDRKGRVYKFRVFFYRIYLIKNLDRENFSFNFSYFYLYFKIKLDIEYVCYKVFYLLYF